MAGKIDFYEMIHKGQRAFFQEISIRLSTIDAEDDKEIEDIYDQIVSLREHMKLHAGLEEKFIHPLLFKYVPGGHRELELDHTKIHTMLGDMINTYNSIKAIKNNDKRVSLLEFYRAWSRFTSFYYLHIDKEEEYVMPTLWKLYDNDELLTVFRTILKSQTPDELRFNLAMMIPALDTESISSLLSSGKVIMPNETYQGVLNMTKNLLEPTKWMNLKEKMGLP